MSRSDCKPQELDYTDVGRCKERARAWVESESVHAGTLAVVCEGIQRSLLLDNCDAVSAAPIVCIAGG